MSRKRGAGPLRRARGLKPRRRLNDIPAMTLEFRYFAQPRRDGPWIDDRETPCQMCGQLSDGGYQVEAVLEDDDGEPTDEVDYVCEACVARGVLADLDWIGPQGDMEALRAQLAERNPELSAMKLGDLVEARFSQLSEKTPPAMEPVPMWPACCGDFCRLDAWNDEQAPAGVAGWSFICLTCGAVHGEAEPEPPIS